MRTGRRTRRLAAVGLAAALALSACGTDDDPADTATELSEEDRLAALEEELARLRDDGDAPADDERQEAGGDEERDDDGASADDAETEDADRTSSDGGTVEPRVFEVGETQTNDLEDLEVTVERIIVHDYHVEVELTAVNDHTEETRKLWNGWQNDNPQLFDEQDRRFVYQHVAGYGEFAYIELEPGQRVDAVLMFGRRLHPDARVLTLRFRDESLDGWEWNVNLAETER